MNKLQKLLNEHKDKITNGYENIELRQMSGGNFRLYLRNEPGDIDYVSLSEIIFNTPFLSWLEWSNGKRGRCHLESYRIHYDNVIEYCYDYGNSDYHKINLCLLNTDEERVKYLEENIIDD